MSELSYYIYALKDPRKTPAFPFYIGKGTGSRAWDHVTEPDQTPKGRRIAEILHDQRAVVVTILADSLSELQALKLEAELIAAFGTEAAGGLLTNSVVPTGIVSKARENLIVPLGAAERAQLGLELLKGAVLELARANPAGISNADASRSLGLQSDYAGGSKDYLAWSILGILMSEGRLRRQNVGRKGMHIAQVR